MQTSLLLPLLTLGLLVCAVDGSLTLRRNILHMSAQDQQTWTKAVNALKREIDPVTGLSTYDSFVVVHATYLKQAHMGPAFFPWHRYFLLRWEAALKRITGDPTMAQPYWDWSHEMTRMNVFVPGLVGGNGTGTDFQIADGPFAGWTTLDPDLQPVKEGIVRTNGAPLKPRPGGMPMPDTGQVQYLPEPDTLAEVLTREGYDSPPYNDTSHDTFRNGFEGWNVSGCYLHNRVHLWTGGQMARVMISVNDPLFWLHHSFVDKVWDQWQQLHSSEPNGGYLPVSGAKPGHNLNDFMDPWPARPADMLSIAQLGYSYEAGDHLDRLVQTRVIPMRAARNKRQH